MYRKDGTMQGLDKYALTPTSKLELLAPNGDVILGPTGGKDNEGEKEYAPVVFELLRTDSKEVQRFINRRKNNVIKDVQRRGGKSGLTAEEMYEHGIDLAVFCTRGWKNVVLGEKELDCTATNSRMLYTKEEYSFIFKQVDEFINDPSNFMGNSSTS